MGQDSGGMRTPMLGARHDSFQTVSSHNSVKRGGLMLFDANRGSNLSSFGLQKAGSKVQAEVKHFSIGGSNQSSSAKKRLFQPAYESSPSVQSCQMSIDEHLNQVGVQLEPPKFPLAVQDQVKRTLF